MFYILVKPVRIESSHIKPVLVAGKSSTLWCMATTSNPVTKIKWRGSRFSIPHDAVTTKISDGEFHGKVVNSTVVLFAKKIWNTRIVTCTPEFNGFSLKNHSVNFILNVTSKTPFAFIKSNVHDKNHCQ